MSLTQALEYDRFYHIYSRSINGLFIFKDKNDFDKFYKLIKKYLIHTFEIYAWAIMSNHFHFLLYVKKEKDIKFIDENSKRRYIPANQISHLLSTYAIYFNNKYNRHGSLFEKPFKRKLVNSHEYFKDLVHYIHFNPVKHKVTKIIEEYSHTSYHTILSNNPTIIQREEIIKWFGIKEDFIEYHKKDNDFDSISDLTID